MDLIKADMATSIIAIVSGSMLVNGIYVLLKTWFDGWRKRKRELKKETPKILNTIVIKGRKGQKLEIPIDSQNAGNLAEAIKKFKDIRKKDIAQKEKISQGEDTGFPARI